MAVEKVSRDEFSRDQLAQMKQNLQEVKTGNILGRKIVAGFNKLVRFVRGEEWLTKQEVTVKKLQGYLEELTDNFRVYTGTLDIDKSKGNIQAYKEIKEEMKEDLNLIREICVLERKHYLPKKVSEAQISKVEKQITDLLKKITESSEKEVEAAFDEIARRPRPKDRPVEDLISFEETEVRTERKSRMTEEEIDKGFDEIANRPRPKESGKTKRKRSEDEQTLKKTKPNMSDEEFDKAMGDANIHRERKIEPKKKMSEEEIDRGFDDIARRPRTEEKKNEPKKRMTEEEIEKGFDDIARRERPEEKKRLSKEEKGFDEIVSSQQKKTKLFSDEMEERIEDKPQERERLKQLGGLSKINKEIDTIKMQKEMKSTEEHPLASKSEEKEGKPQVKTETKGQSKTDFDKLHDRLAANKLKNEEIARRKKEKENKNKKV